MSGPAQIIINLDHTVFNGFNSLAGRSFPVDWLIRVGADDHIIPVVLAMLTLLVLLLADDRSSRVRSFNCVVCALGASVLSMVLLYFMNLAFFRPKPFTSLGAQVILYHNTDSAFCANAAVLGFALAFSVLLYNRKVGAVMVTLASFMGLARIAAGVHYPLDVAGGLLLGLACALLFRALDFSFTPVTGRLTDLEYRFLGSWRVFHGERGGGS